MPLRDVALRKESVDRNIPCGQLPAAKPPSLSARRAWIEITPAVRSKFMRTTSLSARRAWIEIYCLNASKLQRSVALRKESVDRNEWIKAQYPGCRVALRKESVDRNLVVWAVVRVYERRSPQGERG